MVATMKNTEQTRPNQVIESSNDHQDLKALLTKPALDSSTATGRVGNYRAYVRQITQQGVFLLELLSGERINARKAACCLHHLSLNDKVIVNLEANDEAYIIALLEPASAPQSLDLNAVESIQAQNIDLNAKVWTLSADQVKIKAQMATLQQYNLQISSVQYHLIAEKQTTTAKAINFEAQEMSQLLGRSTRTILGADQLKAKHINYSASASASFGGKKTMLNAEQNLQMKAELILADKKEK